MLQGCNHITNRNIIFWVKNKPRSTRNVNLKSQERTFFINLSRRRCNHKWTSYYFWILNKNFIRLYLREFLTSRKDTRCNACHLTDMHINVIKRKIDSKLVPIPKYIIPQLCSCLEEMLPTSIESFSRSTLLGQFTDFFLSYQS